MWETTEPDFNDDEHCGYFETVVENGDSAYFLRLRLHDGNCNEKRHFLCETRPKLILP